MIGDITAADEIYIVCGYTDMRKSIDGLCAIVEVQSLVPVLWKALRQNQDPFMGTGWLCFAVQTALCC